LFVYWLEPIAPLPISCSRTTDAASAADAAQSERRTLLALGQQGTSRHQDASGAGSPADAEQGTWGTWGTYHHGLVGTEQNASGKAVATACAARNTDEAHAAASEVQQARGHEVQKEHEVQPEHEVRKVQEVREVPHAWEQPEVANPVSDSTP
jgi:hypothetical protein